MTNDEILTQNGPRESMAYDVVLGGGGPAGLSTAIRSGAVPDLKPLPERFPNWKATV